MAKVIIHAGFPKCGSTSIFNAIKSNFNRLIDHNIYVFNRTFDLPRKARRLEAPLWQLHDALHDAGKAENLRKRITHHITASSSTDRLILSSENLSNPSMAKLFSGVDDLCDVEMIFYFRPQVDWIPSGWKQWNLKSGFSLEETIQTNVKRKNPNYLASVKAWEKALPKIKVIPRLFARDQMAGGHPAYDFFSLLNIHMKSSELLEVRSNPSIDYSLMHLLYRNSKRIFSGPHDNNVLRALLSMLPEDYKKTNVEMVSQSEADFISDHFHDDNVSLAERYMGMTNHEAQEFVRRHFHKTVQGRAYSDIPENEILDRASYILREITGKGGDPDSLLLELMLPYVSEKSP